MKRSVFVISLLFFSAFEFLGLQGRFELINSIQKKPTTTITLTPEQITTLSCSLDNSKQITETPAYQTVITQDGYQAGYYFFNRNSSTLMLVGPGMLNKAEKLLWVAKFFPTYDIAVVDFRCNSDMGNFLLSSDTLKDPKAALLYNVVRDVEIVIQKIALSRHTHITGYGYCYGGWIFALYQTSTTVTTRRFDSLIFDGLPESLERLLNNILKDADVMGPRNPDKKPGLLQKFTALPLVRKPLTYALTNAFTNFSITPTLADLTIPVLFIQGRADRVASLGQFYKNFGACTSTEKFALLTPYEHVENFKHAGELCARICSKIIEGAFLQTPFNL